MALVLCNFEDRSSVQALCKGHRILGFNNGTGTCIRMCDGIGGIHADCYTFMVPVCFRVPNKVVIQSSIQQRSSDFNDSCWKERQRQYSRHFKYPKGVLKFRMRQFKISVLCKLSFSYYLDFKNSF